MGDHGVWCSVPSASSRTWGLPCTRTPFHLRLPPSLPGPCLRQVRECTQPCHWVTLGGPLLPQMSGVEGQVPAAADVGLPAGMGSQSRPQSTLQGFGYSKERGHTGECCRARGPAEGGWACVPPTDFSATLGQLGRCSRLSSPDW